MLDSRHEQECYLRPVKDVPFLWPTATVRANIPLSRLSLKTEVWRFCYFDIAQETEERRGKL